MGGFELLPSPVPASLMYYSHVARAITPGWNGAAVYPTSVGAGDSAVNTFTFVLPAGWHEDRMHIIGMVIFNNDTITYTDNASFTTLAEAVTNGYETGVEVTGVAQVFADPSAQVELYPNPSPDIAYVKLNLQKASKVTMSVYGVDGKQLQTKDYGTLSSGDVLPIASDLLSAGVYLIEVSVDGKKETMKLVKQ